MDIFNAIGASEHEEVVFCQDKASGLKAIIAVHNTHLGPALGGTRLWPYATEDAALVDVLRLSRGMTYKNAAAGLNLGGGKAVILCDPADKTPELMRAYGRFVDRLNGAYVTAADMNTNEADMLAIAQSTAHVSGLPPSNEGSGSPSPFTALGTFEGIKACIKHRYGQDSLRGISVAVQGLGSVGFQLCEHLHQAGASLWVSDINEERVQAAVQRFEANAVAINDIHKQRVDVFSPCARGAVINDATIGALQCKIIAGAANNQLQDETLHANKLKQRGILYAPDFIINAGGVINISFEIGRAYSKEDATKKVMAIQDTLLTVFEMAEQEGITTTEAAMHYAESRFKV